MEHRSWISLAGIASVGLGIGSSYGFCSAIGLNYTNLHSILPFMLLGIGIDDMFVIAQSFDNIKDSDEEKMGMCMKKAGVAITITSVTDLLAFWISASSVLPILQSFCIYAAFGIMFVFIFMATFFFGFFCLDQRRVEAKRDSCCCRKKSELWKPNLFSQKKILESIFIKIGNILVQKPAKIAVIMLTILFASIATYGVSQIESEFDLKWFLEEGSYVRTFFDNLEKYFPNSGMTGQVYIANVQDYHAHMDDVSNLAKAFIESDHLVGTSGKEGFHSSFEIFVNNIKGIKSYPKKDLAKPVFQKFLAEFLYTSGQGYQNDLKFKTELTCSESAPDIKSLSITYTHKSYGSAVDHINGINAVRHLVEAHKQNFGPEAQVFAYSREYSNFKTMESVNKELMRNILLALLCIFLATLFLIANLFTSLLVCISVLLTLLNVGGFMYFWDLTIEPSAAILFTIAMGLSVDYSAHIAHAFMVSKGTRNERVVNTLTNMGPAVLNGGFSTYLAFSLLMNSSFYVFQTFFKIFFMIVVFGLYHGLIFLPVILSLIGPQSKIEPKKEKVKIAWITDQIK